MKTDHSPIRMVMAEDDLEDQQLAREALEESRLVNPVDFVGNGEELLNYLRRQGPFAHLAGEELPGLILLDLNMPRMDGREALRQIKADPVLHRIPVVVLTTSKAEEDILRSYDLGVNSFIVKPVSFSELVEVMRSVTRYWFEIVRLPNGCHDAYA